MAPDSLTSKWLFVKTLTPDQPAIDEVSQAKVRSHAAKITLLKRRSSTDSPAKLRGGNSDPFHALAVTITPRVSYAINFRKTRYIPACPFSHGPTWAPCKGRRKGGNIAVHEELSELRKPGTASAFALHLVGIQARIESHDQGWKYDMLRLKIDSFNAVQQAVKGGNTREAVNAMHWLFADAVMSGNLKEALTHGFAIKKLLISGKSQDSPVDRSDLIHVLWLDSHMSMTFMRHPIFDSDWASNEVYGFSRIAEGCSIEDDDFDSSIPKELCKIIAQVRYASSMWNSPVLPLPRRNATELVNWIIAHSHIRKSRLITFYLNNSESIAGCMALALLSVDLTQGCDPTLGKRRLLPSMQTVMRHFYADMQTFMKPSNAVLWCLFIGAYIEEREARHDTNLWFKVTFASMARQMGLSSWPQIQNVVQNFLYDDTFKPAGEEWVERTLHAEIEEFREPLRMDIPSWVQPRSASW